MDILKEKNITHKEQIYETNGGAQKRTHMIKATLIGTA